jgi:cytochrome c553
MIHLIDSLRFFLLLITIVLTGSRHYVVAEDISFNRDIRPILSDRCYYCHGFDENHREANLRLDIREEAQWVWDTESPDDSELILRITSDDPDEVMPPPYAHKQAITNEEVDLIRRWIEQGAQYEPHWAFVKPERPDTKAEHASAAIDDFVSRRHQEHDLRFAAPAMPTKWLRRASLDLTGVPPTFSELKAFERAVEQQGETAYQKAVDRMLASAKFGERMALDWLDVARFADTNGFQTDAYRMNWPWRDWVIQAFNDNMPFDQFTIEQLAGDLLEDPTEDQLVATAFNRNHMIQAEGGSIPEENRAKNGFDRVETTGTTWMGLTVGCAQCHDHKFDPIKQKDYFSLMAFFNQIGETGMTSKKMDVKRSDKKFARKYWVDKRFIAVGEKETKQKLAEERKKVNSAKKVLEERKEEYVAAAAEWVEETRKDPEAAEKSGKMRRGEFVARFLHSADVNDPENKDFKKLIEVFLKRNDPWKAIQKTIDDNVNRANLLQEQIPLVMVMRDDQPRETYVMLRGNYETLGEKVTASTPSFLPPLKIDKAENEGSPSKPNRLDLARWLVSPDHPLTARVTVNRYWQLLFGRGLVSTPDDFGLQGALPSHPDLLDWLAVEFQQNGWNLKALLKSIVLSRTYRQSAIVDDTLFSKDADNQWLARGPRQRLDSRLLRDQALALSGLLNAKIGGPPVAPYQPDGVWEAMSLNKNHYMRDHGDELYRRSLYTVWRRVVAPTNFFDVPARQACSVRQTRTSTPLHALTTLNDVTYVEAARVWAELLVTTDGDDARLSRMFYEATARMPEPVELDALTRSLEKARVRYRSKPKAAEKLISTGESPLSEKMPADEHAAWTTVCLTVLNLDETLCK